MSPQAGPGGRQTVSDSSEWKIVLRAIALLNKVSDNQVCIVVRIGPATYQYGIIRAEQKAIVFRAGEGGVPV